MVSLFKPVQFPNFFSFSSDLMHFIQFRPSATSFPGFLHSLTLISKSKKDLGNEFGPYAFIQDFCWLLMQRSRVLFGMWIISKIGAITLFKINMAEKGVCRACFLYCNFLYGLFAQLMTPKGRKIRLSPSSLNSLYYFLIFWFKGFGFKTRFKFEFCPLVNRGQLVLE